MYQYGQKLVWLKKVGGRLLATDVTFCGYSGAKCVLVETADGVKHSVYLRNVMTK